MDKVVILLEEENQWSYFFMELTKEYILSEDFLSMLGILPRSMGDFVSIVKRAFKNTMEHFNEEEIYLPTAWWKLCNELKSRVVTSHKHSLAFIGDTVIDSIKEYISQNKTKLKTRSRLVDVGDFCGNKEMNQVYTTIEQNQVEANIKKKTDESEKTYSVIGYLESDNRAIDLSIKLSYQLSAAIGDYQHRDLVKAYKTFMNDSTIRTLAGKNYKRFKRECEIFKEDLIEFRKIPKELREVIKSIVNHMFQGKSFPTFPGLISDKSCLRFPNIHQEAFIPIFSFRVHGEGWDQTKTILPLLLKLKHDLKSISIESAKEYIGNVRTLIDRYLDIISIKISYEKFTELYDYLEQLIDSDWVPDYNFRIEYGKQHLSNRVKISPKPIYTNELIVHVHENTDNLNLKTSSKGTYWKDDNIYGLQNFVSYLLANTNFFPKSVKIYHREINCDIQRNPSGNTRFFAILKSAIDSAILYLAMIGDPEVKKFLRSSNHEFKSISSTNNIWFLPFTMKEGETNTLFHDYYYMLLKGVTAWEARYFERYNTISPIHPVNDSRSFDFAKMVDFAWKNKTSLNRLRRRMNVQVMNLPKLRKKGDFSHNLESLTEFFGNPTQFYKFKNAGEITCFYAETKNKTRCINLPSLYLKRFMSQRSKRTPQVMGMLSTDPWYYAAHSLKNTSTAGYSLVDYNSEKSLETSDVLLLSLGVETWYYDKENDETSYLRHCSLFSHLTNQREIQILDEYFIDDYIGDVNEESHLQTASKIIAELSKHKIPIVMRVKYSQKTEKSYQLMRQAVKSELLRDSKSEKPSLDYNDAIINWLIKENKKKIVPLFVFMEKAIITPPNIIKEKEANQQITFILEHPILSHTEVEQKIIGLLIYGSRKESIIKKGKPIRKDLFPSFIFTVIPKNTDSRDIRGYLEKLVTILPCYADEKGGSSVASLRRLFNLPNPDPGRIVNPSIFIKGVNRLDFPQEVK